MADWRDEYIRQIVACQKHRDRLSDWDSDFLISVRSQLDKGKIPSTKQIETLEKIWLKLG